MLNCELFKSLFAKKVFLEKGFRPLSRVVFLTKSGATLFA